MIDVISLDAHWCCEYFEDDPDEVQFATGIDVPTLAGWTFDPLRRAGWAAWLEKRFDLPLQDLCVNYDLSIDAAPSGTRLYINGRDFGLIAAPLRIDVTDTVALEDNVIALRVPGGSTAAFGSCRLITIPCD